jgi:diacylglycerol O-acyltransferase / wax synthase
MSRSTESILLGPEDRAILSLESATVVGHTCKVLRLGPGGLDVEDLRERVAERIASGLAPALTWRLNGSAEAPAWRVDQAFDVADHVVAAPVAGPLDQDGLRGLVATLFEQRLDRGRPLWRMDVAALDDGGTAIVWRIHHALADGTASVRYAGALLWDETLEPGPSGRGAGADGHDQAAEVETAGGQSPAGRRADADGHDQAAVRARAEAIRIGEEARRIGHLGGFLKREFAEARSPFDGEIGRRREVGFAVVSLRQLQAASKAVAGATVNDAVLAVLAGGLHDWIAERHGHLGAVRVKVPVSLHHEGEDFANRDSYFSLSLPLNEQDQATRLRVIHERTMARKRGRDAQEMEVVMHELAGVSPGLQRFCARLQASPREFAVCVSNVPGPRRAVRILDAPVRTIYSIAEIGERHALRVAAISVADTLCFGFCSDPALIDGVQDMADMVHNQARALIDSVHSV